MCDNCDMFPIIGTRYKVYFKYYINKNSVQFVKILIFVKNVKIRIIMIIHF